MRVTDLLIKVERQKPLLHVEYFEFDKDGIRGNIPCLSLRQVLLIPKAVLLRFQLQAGDLRENIVIDYDNLHELPSGTVVKIGEALIRLTFHCEPCKVIQNKVNLRQIKHNRGVLGCFLNAGTIRVGDSFQIEGKFFESIPYELADRIRWYLDKQQQPVNVTKMLKDIGLSITYARAVPSLLRKLPISYSELVVFGSKKIRCQQSYSH